MVMTCKNNFVSTKLPARQGACSRDMSKRHVAATKSCVVQTKNFFLLHIQLETVHLPIDTLNRLSFIIAKIPKKNICLKQKFILH